MLFIALTNTTSHEIRPGGGIPSWLFYRLEIHDQAGKEPPFTAYMKEMNDHSGAGLMPQFWSGALKPGESFEDVYEVTDVYDLSPGIYTIRAVRAIPEELGGRKAILLKDLTPDDVVVSNEITVTVTK